MTEFKRVFIDTAPIIYYLENKERCRLHIKLEATFRFILMVREILELSEKKRKDTFLLNNLYDIFIWPWRVIYE